MVRTSTSMSLDLPTDAALPGLSIASPDRMLEALRGSPLLATAEERGAWQSCTMMEAVYQPGRACRIAYALGPHDESERRDLLYARWDPQSRPHESAVQLWADGTSFDVFRYPRDRRMRQIRSMHRDAWLRKASEQWFRRVWGDGHFSDDGWRCTPIKYVPESRLVCRLKGDWTGAGDDRWARAYVRISRRNDAESQYHSLRNICEALAGPESKVTAPYPLGCMPSRHLLAAEFVRGRSLKELALDRSSDEVVSICRRLATLHQFRPDVGRHGAESEPMQMDDMLSDLAAGLPDGTDACNDLTSWSARHPLPPKSTGLVHGDLHCGQIIVRADRVCVVDWDRATIGDGTQDILNLALELAEAPWLQTDSCHIGGKLASACVDAWRSAGGPWNVGAVRWWAVRSLVLRAWGLMRHLRPDWPSASRRLLEHAQRMWHDGLEFEKA